MAYRNIEALAAPLYIGNGANRVKIGTDGTMTLEGTATVFDDLNGNINGANLFSTAGKADYDHDEGHIEMQPSGSLAAAGDVVVVKYQLKHQMVAGAVLKPHIHWRQPNATIQFTWKYRWTNNLTATDTAWSSDVVVNATGTANAVDWVSGSLDQITKLGDIATTGIGLSAILQIKLARTDATAGNIFIYDIDAHQEIDALGSSAEYVK